MTPHADIYRYDAWREAYQLCGKVAPSQVERLRQTIVAAVLFTEPHAEGECETYAPAKVIAEAES